MDAAKAERELTLLKSLMGRKSFIGFIDESTVLKYPHIPGDEKALALLSLEARILQAIGPHKHIIGFKGLTRDGLLLERAPFGSINEYLKNTRHPQVLGWKIQLGG